MKYEEFKKIIKHLVKRVNCPNCEAKYKEKDLSIIATMPEEMLLSSTCTACNVQAVIHVALYTDGEIYEGEDFPTEHIQFETTLAPIVSEDDFLDIKNFLSGFNGDFKKLFSSK